MGKEIQALIVDRALKGSGLGTYSDLATRLGVSAPTLSQWRKGINPIPEKRLEQLCRLSGDNLGAMSMALAAERTQVRSLRASIHEVLKAAGHSLPAILVAVLVLGSTSPITGRIPLM